MKKYHLAMMAYSYEDMDQGTQRNMISGMYYKAPPKASYKWENPSSTTMFIGHKIPPKGLLYFIIIIILPKWAWIKGIPLRNLFYFERGPQSSPLVPQP